MTLVTDADIQAYRENGAIVLRGVFRDWIERLRAGVEYNITHPGTYGKLYTKPGNPGRFFGDYCNWDRIPEYRDFLFDSPAAQIAARLMESTGARLFHEHVLVKEPGTLEATPWHQDQPYYCVDGWQVCSLWIPLDAVPKATCPEYVAGSHRWGRWFMPRRFTGADFNHTDARLEATPDIDAQRDAYQILSWDLEPGDALAFHFMTLHGAPANRTELRRRGFAARWLGDDAVFAQRSGDISPPFPGLEKKLRVGGPLDSEEFPLVWPRLSPYPLPEGEGNQAQ
ncbi:MAG: phytanoyl-CoA dioxygenase family protein [Gammaproteobacteria bacterium]